MRRLCLLFLLVLIGSTARAETELVAAFPDAIRGPAAAHGAIIWNHGLSQEEPNAAAALPATMALFRDAGWDVYRLKRGIAGDTEDASTTALLAAIDTIKAKGYTKLVTAGQSFGSWISLNAAGRTDKLTAVLVDAPAAYGDASKSGYERNAGLLFPKLEALPQIPVVIAFFNHDLFDPGGRGPKADEILTGHGVPHLIIDRPAVLQGHGSGSSVYFARRFGACWLAAAETGQVPALSACETHWGESPSADLLLPEGLTIAPGGLAGKWYGNYTIGREVMLVVTRIDGNKVEATLCVGPSNSAAARSDPQIGQLADGALVFAEAGKPRLTLTPMADGTANLLWVSVDGKSRIAAAVHRVP